MSSYQAPHSRQSSLDTDSAVPDRKRVEMKAEEATQDLHRKFQELQERNTALAKLLENALQDLRAIRLTNPGGASDAEENLNICLAKIQFVSVYLANPDIPVPQEEAVQAPQPTGESVQTPEKHSTVSISEEAKSQAQADADAASGEHPQATAKDLPPDTGRREPTKSSQRPSLIDSSFSFMLGEDRHRSSFVSSVADLPEQRRGIESISRIKKTPAETEARRERKESECEDVGFTLTKIQGGQG